MKFTDIFIQRPVLATVVSLLIFLLGLKSIFDLDLRQFPKVENTVITVTTAYPGASSDLIQGFITQPLQTAISSADGIDYITSSSAQSISTIKAKLRLNFDSARAFADILAKVNSVTNELPKAANQPVITKTTGSSIALMYINYSSDKLKSSQIYDFLVRVVQPKLQSVAGVASADILGGNPFALRVWLEPRRMGALGVTTDDVAQALIANNYQSAAGQLKGPYTLMSLNAFTDLHQVQDFENIVIRNSNGKSVYLRDVAKVELGSESYGFSVTFNGKKGVFVAINALPNANPLTVIDSVRKTLPEMESSLPPSLHQKIVYDSTKFISNSIHDVVKTLVEATLIVILVIFAFIGSLRSVLIPIITIPLSLVGVAFIMMLLGYSINLLTLLAMVLAIGLVVDDAIVVLENIHRHIEEGMSGFDAAVKGAREIASPVVSMTLTLAAVYAPIGLMSGLTGALFKEFALTLAASVVVSGIVALTLSPMMCSKILIHDDKPESLSHKVDAIFTKLQNRYRNLLTSVLKARAVVLLFGSVVFVSVFVLFVLTPSELAPQEDKGFLFTIISAPPYANSRYFERYTKEIDKIFNSVPEQEAHFIINGAGQENNGFAGIVFKPWNDRNRKAQQIQEPLQHKLDNIAGIKSFLVSMPDLPTGSDGPPFQMVVKTTASYKELNQVMKQLEDRAKKTGLFIFAGSDLSFDTPQVDVHIDTKKAASLNVSMETIGNSLALMLGGNDISRFSMDGRSYKVIPQLKDKDRYHPADLARTFVRSQLGKLIPLSNFVSFKTSTVPGELKQFQQLNSATLSGMMRPGQTLAKAIQVMDTTAKEVLPKGMSVDYSGDSRALLQEGSSLIYAFGFALIMIFLVLAAQFESFRDPLVILISVPMAICGALIPLNLGLATINIYTQIGLVTLIGLITKHGILMVQFANQIRREKGVDAFEGIIESATVRLRPILMTTAAMVLGVVPLILASGAGAASRHDIGLVIAAGLTIGTLFTLFVVPTMYTFITKKDLG